MKDKEKNKGIKTSIGGQALLEGIMMRGPKRTSMAVRNPDGEIVIEEWDTVVPNRPAITRWPFVRGIFNFVDSMKTGMKCLTRSAELSGLEELEEEAAREKEAKKRAKAEKKRKDATPSEEKAEESVEEKASETSDEPIAESDLEMSEEKPEEKEEVTEAKEEVAKEEPLKEEKKGTGATTAAVMSIGTVLGLVLALVLFIWLPTFLGTLILGPNAASEHSAWLTVISGVIKMIILVAYMSLVSLMKDIRRVFMYHGAEHKTIFCYEHGHELTVENVKRERRFHPRCGTSFLFLMVLVSIAIMIPIGILYQNILPASVLSNKLVYTLIRTATSLVFLPLIVGIGYELIRLAGKHDNLFTRIMSAPGLWMQRITTKEPDDSMIECAIEAVKRVIPDDGSDHIK